MVVTCQFEKIIKRQNQLPWVYIYLVTVRKLTTKRCI